MSEINVTTIKNENADYGPSLVGHSTVTGDLRVSGTYFGNGSGLTGVANTDNIKADTITVSGVVTATTFDGNISGGVTGDFSVEDKIVHTGDTNTTIRFPAADTFTVETGGTERMRIASDGLATFAGNVLSGSDPNDGGAVGTKMTSTGVIQATRSSGASAVFMGYTQGTTDPTTRINGDGSATFTGNVDLQDNDKLILGTGDDLQIYHDGTDSTINNITGDLIITTTGSGDDVQIISADDIFLIPQGSENGVNILGNGAVELYYDNSKKLETTTSGVTVTGDVNSTSDINLKKDIEVVTNATEMLNQLRGVKFTWKENEEKSVGVIAQEVETILPELVRGEEGDKSVNYSGLIGVLIESVKELSARVEELENR